MRTFNLGLLLLVLLFSQTNASIDPSDQFLQGLGRTTSSYPEVSEGNTLNFNSQFAQNPWLGQFNDNIINGADTPPALRQKGQTMLDQVEELDRRCAALADTDEREACGQQRDAALSQMEKMVADNNPDLKILLSQSASQAGDFSSEFDPAAMKDTADGAFAQMGNLMDMLGGSAGLPGTPTQEALETPRPSGSSANITQQLNVGSEQLAHLRQAERETIPVSDEPQQGFFDRIRNFWQDFKPGVQQAFTIQVWAQAPFGTLGQTGQSQLRTITASRATADFNRESKGVNDARDRSVTRHNDIAGQGRSALQERAEQNLEVMNETTQAQDGALQSIEHICQNQRSSVPCWQNGNDIPFDLLALLMGAVGGGGSENPEALDLEPYAVWLHCPMSDQPFNRSSEGIRMSGLLLDEKERLILTLDSKLPQPLHADGCIVALNADEGWQYYNANRQPEVIAGGQDQESVEADLALLKIETIYTEEGQALADPDVVFEDFINEYWPDHLRYCQNDPAFRIGDELSLYGFEALEEESVEVDEVTELNGLANFVADENGATSFTTNGEESFNSGVVARQENGCFKGLAQITIDAEEGTNQQDLLPLSLISDWLKTQNITLPEPNSSGENDR